MYLKPHSTLQDSKYQVVRVLGQGGFGITYEAIQVGLRRKVAIKEFFMKGYCNRDSDTSAVTHGMTDDSRGLVERYMSKFVREAQMIAGMDHPNIVRIYDVFEENGTAYYVMEYLEGGSLESIVVEKGRLPVKEACGYIRQVGAALKYIHSHQSLHFDVKPSNVLLNKDGRAVLIDFGVSKHYDEAGNQTSSTPVGISKGYAPLEQYQAAEISTFTPATDIYALGATLYRLVTGNVPPSASEVNEDGLPEMNGVPGNVAKAIKAAMQPRRKDRPQSIDEFLALLDSSAPETTKAAEETVIINTSPKKKKGVPSWVYAVISAVVIAVGVFLLWPKGGNLDSSAIPKTETDSLGVQQQVPPELMKNDSVNKEKESIVVKEIILSDTEISAEEGEIVSLKVSVRPSNATDKTVSWKSSNQSVAKVTSNGKVSAIKAGSAVIIASAGEVEARCIINVIAKSTQKEDAAATKSARELYVEGYNAYEAARKANNKESIDKAVALLEKAANMGNLDAIVAVGAHYYICKEYERATPWLQKAADRNEMNSTAMLASCYLTGNGVPKDEKKALSLAKLAHKNGNSEATYLLGYMYEEGLGGLTVDIKKAYELYKKAADNNVYQAKSALEALMEDYPDLLSNNKIAGHEWVDLGLSVKWATCNVGASSESDYGDYFAWGEVTPKSEYTRSNYKYRSEDYGFSKYVTDSLRGRVDNKMKLDFSDDAARYNWGGSWRMPTLNELNELREKCKWLWTTKGGHNGYLVTGPSGKSIFLPAAGGWDEDSFSYEGTLGAFWTASLNLSYSDHAYVFAFNCVIREALDNGDRFSGASVRPVTE